MHRQKLDRCGRPASVHVRRVRCHAAGHFASMAPWQGARRLPVGCRLGARRIPCAGGLPLWAAVRAAAAQRRAGRRMLDFTVRQSPQHPCSPVGAVMDAVRACMRSGRQPSSRPPWRTAPRARPWPPIPPGRHASPVRSPCHALAPCAACSMDGIPVATNAIGTRGGPGQRCRGCKGA